MRPETTDFHRLLSPVGDAAFNRGGPVARCHPGTREELMAKIIRWSDGGSQTEIGSDRPICWLSGPAGSGKSAVSQTFAEYCERKKRLAASFFFLRGAKDRSAFARFISTLTHQISVSIPTTKPRIRRAMRSDPSIPQRAIRHQFKKLMLEPLLKARPISAVIPLRKIAIIVVDALDECSDDDLVAEFIEVVIDLSHDRPFPFRIFFTSRMEEHIRMKFKTPRALSATYFISLQDFDAGVDIHTFFRSRFSAIYSENRLMQGIPRPWPSDLDVQVLVQKASGSFIFASTLVDFVNDGSDLPQRKLAAALRTHAGLDHLYAQVLISAGFRGDHFERVIGTVMLLKSSFSIISLGHLLQLETGDILHALLGIQSILMIPEDNDGPVRPFHTSLRDFLTTRERSKDLFIDPPMRHLFIATDCLRVVTLDTRSDVIRDEVYEYACVNWCHHLHQGLIQGAQDLTVNGSLLMSCLIDFESLSLGRWIETLIQNNQLRDTVDILHLALMCLKKMTNCPQQFIQVLSNVESISMQSIPISSQDIIIVMIGATGAGKSTFINTAIGNGLPGTTEQDLDSSAQKVQTVRCRHPYKPDGHSIVLVDTPGFEQDLKANFEVLHTIAGWLKMTYEQGINLSGLLFLQPISDNRTTHSLNYTQMVEKLCGTDALQLVIPATTMWDIVAERTGEEREGELRAQWGTSFITVGSRMARSDNTCQSAWGILDQFTDVRRPLLLQMEMVDEGRSLIMTAAGSMLFGQRTEERFSMQSISHQDIIIAVIGATGVGKSSFINIAVGNNQTTIGHDLRSCLQGVQAITCRHPKNPDRRIVFLDTPGFDDTSRTDTEVLTDISEFLKTTYKKGIKLTGLLFLHRISDHRMTGTSRKNTDIFEMVCDPDALQNVILVTTMWDKIDMTTGLQHEKELRTDFWQSMIAFGSQIARFESTYQSAWKILNQFTGDAPLQEMVERKRKEGDILPVTEDPCNWCLFAHPDNSHYGTLSELAESSRRSFEIIELWQKQRGFVCFSAAGNYDDGCSSESINSSRHPLIKEMIDKIAKQGPAYYRAIQKSAETARRGCSFASDAIDFCNRLRKAEDSMETLRAGLDDIEEVAECTCQDAQELYYQFKDVRVELFKILKDIPSGALSSETDQNVYAQFLQACNDLGSLIQNVVSFVDWWGDMNMSLTNLEEILPEVRVDGTSLFRTDIVTRRWKTVHMNYVWYQRQIGEVEDYYKNVSGDLTPRSNFKEIEGLFDDETVVTSTEEK